MGGKSTLYKKSVSSDTVVNQDAYDLKSWQGLTSLLKAGKEALEPSAYGEFRNLVLQYAQHGGDAEFKHHIDAVIATFGQKKEVPTEISEEISSAPEKTSGNPIIADVTIAPEVFVPDEKFKEAHVLSTRRVQPRFVAPVSVPDSNQSDVVISDIPQTPPKVVSEPIPPPTPEIRVPEIIPEELSVETLPQSAPLIPEPVLSVPATFVSPTTSFATLEQCKLRISEIKRTVNAHFGNPVALMAVPNNLGKIYMTALLSALKVTGSGTPGNVDFVMAELEQAYNALLQGDSLIAQSTPEPLPQTPPKVVSEPIPPPTPEIRVPEIIPEELSVETLPQSAPLIPEPVLSVPVIQEISTQVPPPSVEMPVQETVAAPQTEVIALSVADEPPAEALISKNPKASARVLEELRATMSALEKKEEKVEEKESFDDRVYSTQDIVHTKEPLVPTRADDMQSAFAQTDHTISAVVSALQSNVLSPTQTIADVIADNTSGYDHWNGKRSTHTTQHKDKISPDREEIIHKENKHSKKGIGQITPEVELEAQGTSTADVLVRQSELSSPQITSMLNNLLHEWSIFSGSGFFGTGPGGAEHPLYITLAPIGMGEVISGRWNNADPKVLKIIKQYVDAWRHEQGITFTPTETFDHYLRRVVQRILKRQNL